MSGSGWMKAMFQGQALQIRSGKTIHHNGRPRSKQNQGSPLIGGIQREDADINSDALMGLGVVNIACSNSAGETA